MLNCMKKYMHENILSHCAGGNLRPIQNSSKRKCNSFASRTITHSALLSRYFLQPTTSYFCNRLHSFALSLKKSLFNKLTAPYMPVLLPVHHLEDVKLQIIGLVCRPENRMVTGLRAEFHLPQSLMRPGCRLTDGFGKKLRVHEM